MGQPPHLRYSVFAVGPDTALLAFEVPGYDPVADGIGVARGRRGRIDHFALRVDTSAFSDVRDRLVAAGASDGAVTALGPYQSVHPSGIPTDSRATSSARSRRSTRRRSTTS